MHPGDRTSSYFLTVKSSLYKGYYLYTALTDPSSSGCSLRGESACFLPRPGLALFPWGTDCTVFQTAPDASLRGADSPGREERRSTTSLYAFCCTVTWLRVWYFNWNSIPSADPTFPSTSDAVSYFTYFPDPANSDNYFRSCLNLFYLFEILGLMFN